MIFSENRFQRAEGMFHRLATLAHGQGVLVEALLRRLRPVGGLSPTGPRRARPDDRLRRDPPFTYAKKVTPSATTRPTRCIVPYPIPGAAMKCNPLHTWKPFIEYIQQRKYKIARGD
jgi:hypothetical protein